MVLSHLRTRLFHSLVLSLKNIRGSSAPRVMRMALLLLITAASLATGGCAASSTTRIIEATAYCNCSKCCEWERGNATYLKLDFWNKYQSSGPDKGRPYSGLTANGSVPREPEEGFFSVDSIRRPWMIPFRLLLFPWYFLPHDGTLAADTSYYPFGTRIHVPGYGWGVVQDRGGAIKGPDRLDLYFHSHHAALEWGRKKVRVTIVFP